MNGERTFILVLVDIDHFKSVNDTHGHDVGDVVLKELADSLVDNLRTRDIVARFGGEEFVIMLQGEPLSLLIQKVHNLRALIEKTELVINDKLSLSITCSFGVAAVQPTYQASKSGVNLNDLLKFADLALYQSKRDGRNKVSIDLHYCDDKQIN